MEIRLSRYNAPFSEPCTSDIHYISLDDQRDIRAGRFDSHIQLYRSIPVTRTLEVFDSLTGSSFTHELTGTGFFRPFNSSPSVDRSDIDPDFIESLRKSRVTAAMPVISRCFCGNHRRPWRCTCNR